ncbi:FYN-binding protein isoform X2 [Notothenia coriiceps]|uniref:FYN-binding protein isoform X2 n=1 Tax=Notothenia coriiceps TaxID=8208 RepID=A0A6I9N272_9TELE|nr:PREDICTED: FYN-binding protein-like isoform X2 [Notothenia coriiceps]
MEEGLSGFKALRAKFQEEALLAQSKASRPPVAEKPKYLPPSGGHFSSLVSSINIPVENKPPVPRVIFRDGLRASGGKRPISFPPQPQQTSPSSQPTNGEATIRHSIKDRHMALVLPLLHAKEKKTEPPVKKEHKLDPEPEKEVPPQTKIKKKGLLLPFKSTKASKISAENGNEPMYADLTIRPSSAPGELSLERQTIEDGLSLPSDQSTAEYPLSSPDIPITPPTAESSVDSENKFMSTLEKAKKKFSRKQMLISVKAKSWRSPDFASRDEAFSSPPNNLVEPELPKLPIPSPVYLPHLACLSARPFFKADYTPHKYARNKQFGRDQTLPHVKSGEPHPTLAPRKEPLPDLMSLGPLPKKPPRPPFVDLSCYHQPTVNDFPESAVSEQWSQSEEVNMDPLSSTKADKTDPGDAESNSAVHETANSNHAALYDGSQPHPDVSSQDSYYEACDNVYEDVENINKFTFGQNSRKRKAGLKNPYVNRATKEEAPPHLWQRNPRGSLPREPSHPSFTHAHSKERNSPNTAEHKERKKREKQRLEKEKKELKEREKKEHEIKKKFKVTGEEEAMYHVKAMVASKVRKNDLPVQKGDTVGIIRTTNCPKGKWLARDTNHKYGYISVMNVELNIKEMLELGKKAQAAGRGGNLEADTISIGSRSSGHLVLTSSFTDDSEEWACEDETLSPINQSQAFPNQTVPLPEMSCDYVSAHHTLSDANLEDLHTQTRHDALQKLAIFFQHSKEEFDDIPDGSGVTPTNAEPPNFLCAVEEPPYPEQEVDFTELEILSPPLLYADDF